MITRSDPRPLQSIQNEVKQLVRLVGDARRKFGNLGAGQILDVEQDRKGRHHVRIRIAPSIPSTGSLSRRMSEITTSNDSALREATAERMLSTDTITTPSDRNSSRSHALCSG